MTSRRTASGMPGWLYTVSAVVAGVLSIGVLIAGSVVWGILGLLASGIYGVGFRRWDEKSADRTGPTKDSARFRWPRYWEHPLLNRVRWAAVVLSFVGFAAILILAAVR